MKKITTIVTEEFDKDGKITNRITETTTEEDNGYIYPQRYYPVDWPVNPTIPTDIYKTDSTC